jgi:hypothetical protein
MKSGFKNTYFYTGAYCNVIEDHSTNRTMGLPFTAKLLLHVMRILLLAQIFIFHADSMF